MSEQPYDEGGLLPSGLSSVVNDSGKSQLIVGKQIFAVLEGGTVIGPALIDSIEFSHAGSEWGAAIRTTPPRVEHSVTFEQIPPKTRREKRDRNAFNRLLWGDMLPNPAQRRLLIHNGRKP